MMEQNLDTIMGKNYLAQIERLTDLYANCAETIKDYETKLSMIKAQIDVHDVAQYHLLLLAESTEQKLNDETIRTRYMNCLKLAIQLVDEKKKLAADLGLAQNELNQLKLSNNVIIKKYSDCSRQLTRIKRSLPGRVIFALLRKYYSIRKKIRQIRSR